MKNIINLRGNGPEAPKASVKTLTLKSGEVFVSVPDLMAYLTTNAKVFDKPEDIRERAVLLGLADCLSELGKK